MSEIFTLVGEFIAAIVEGIKAGESNEEIRKRIAAPGSVGDKLIEAVRSRQDKFADYIKNG